MVHGQAADYNIVNLDNNTLKMLTGKDVPAFVRFDRDYPYGEKVGWRKNNLYTEGGSQWYQPRRHAKRGKQIHDVWNHIVIFVDSW